MPGSAVDVIPAGALAQARTVAMDDEQIQRTFRKAAALAASGLFKDVRSAEQAFAKLLIGHTLGLNEAQSLSLYAMEGKIEVPYPMLANFIRSREGYSYRVAWIKSQSGRAIPEGTVPEGADAREAVWADEDEATDLRPIVGCSIVFDGPEGRRGVSTWTIEDTLRAQLDRDRGSAKSNHTKYPRNLYLARSMSNGVKWYMSEVLGGLPVYAEGELSDRGALGDEGAGSGEEPGWGEVPIAAVHEVEKIIRRARRLGHAGLSDRATAQMTLTGQSDDAIRSWIDRATAELGAFAAGRPTEAPTPPEAEVVEPSPDAPERPEEVLEPQTGEEHADEPTDADRGMAEEEAVANAGGEREPTVSDELGPATREQLTRELGEAEVLAASAQTEGEHHAAKAEVERIRGLLSDLDAQDDAEAQQRLGEEG